MSDFVTIQRRADIIHRARIDSPGLSYWFAEALALPRLDRLTNVSNRHTMSRAVLAILRPEGAKRAGGGLHGAPFGRGVGQSGRVVDSAIALCWHRHRYDETTTGALAAQVADYMNTAGGYKPSVSTTAARIGEQRTAAFGAFETTHTGRVRLSVYGLIRAAQMGLR